MLFDELVEHAPAVRTARLAEIRIDDPAVAHRVARLLAAIDDATDRGNAAGADRRGVGQDADEDEDDRHDPLLGTLLGPAATGWRLEAVLGVGGSGRVYRARRVSDDLPAAVKRIDARHLSAAGLDRLAAEIAATRRIEHPGVVRVLDASTDHEPAPADGADAAAAPRDAPRDAWIAFELVAGARWITEHALDLAVPDAPDAAPVQAAIELLLQACDAVGAAHAAGIVHRDLKPGNLLVGADGRVRVIDFGIARLVGPLGDGPTLLVERTRDGVVLGTPAYMAPEQVDPRLGPISPRTDVHALAVLGYRLLAGRMPYAIGDTLLSAAQAIRHVPPRPLRDLAPDVAPAVEAVLVRALAKDPARRPADAHELARELQRAIDAPLDAIPSADDDADHATSSPPARATAATSEATRPQRPRRSRFLAAGLLLPLLLLATWLGGRDPMARHRIAWTPADAPLPAMPLGAGGRILRVPADHPTVPDAVAAARDGDSILVAPGIWSDPFVVDGRTIEIRGDGHAAEVILEPRDGGGMLTVRGIESAPIFRNLTFRGSVHAPAILIEQGSPRFERCIVRDNVAVTTTDSVAVRDRRMDRSPRAPAAIEPVGFTDCLFFGNRSSRGGALSTHGHGLSIVRSAFVANEARDLVRPGSVVLEHGGALYLQTRSDARSGLEIVDCVFAANRAARGGAMWLRLDGTRGPPAVLHRIVLAGNEASMAAPAIGQSYQATMIEDAWTDRDPLVFAVGNREGITESRTTVADHDAMPPYDDSDGDGVPDRLAALLFGASPPRLTPRPESAAAAGGETAGTGLPEPTTRPAASYEDVVLAADPLRYWRMRVVDGRIPSAVPGGPALEIHGSVEPARSPVGCRDDRSLALDGLGWLDGGDDPALDRARLRDFSVSVWIRPAAFDDVQWIVGKGRDIEIESWGLKMHTVDVEHFIGLVAVPAGTQTRLDADDFARWIHVVATFDPGTGARSIWIDGRRRQLEISALEVPTAAATAPLLIGRHPHRNEAFHWNFLGAIDEVAIFDRVLTDDEIRAQFEAADPERACEASAVDRP